MTWAGGRLLCLVLVCCAGVMGRAADLPRSALDAAAAFSAAHGGVALLVREHGQTVLEQGQTAEPHKIYSGTKGFWILAALAAEREGVLRLDDRVAESLPEWQSDPQRAGITLRDLLTFTAGVEPKFELHGNGSPDRNRAALGAAIVAERGRAFIYGPAALQVFAEVLKRRLAGRGQTPTEYLESRVLKPLGLGPQRYLLDQAGNPLLATGFLLTAGQWAHLGQAILAQGKPLIPAHELAECFRGSPANRAFGMGFWNNRAAGGAGREVDIEDLLELKWFQQDWRGVCLCRDAPEDLIAAIGSGYQRMYVVPSRGLVVVRFGNGTRFADAEFLRLLFGKK